MFYTTNVLIEKIFSKVLVVVVTDLAWFCCRCWQSLHPIFVGSRGILGSILLNQSS